MSWQITIADDADTTGEATITGVWTDKAGEHTFSMRARSDAKGQDVFIQAAMKARDEWQVKKTAELDFIDTCLAKLNATDEKAATEIKAGG
jgi:hypothetical protein